jgi:glycosyltransferase involved in cell wall biosynthesis
MISNQNKLISYVIPTLNSAETIEWTILSLNQQKSVDVKIIVVDSGSTDGTLEICKKWGIETHYVPPGNMYAAINHGLRLCDTEWVGYLNSDDILYKNTLIKLIENGDRNDADLVYGICDFIDTDGRFLYSFIPPKPKELVSAMRYGGSCISQPSVIFKKDIFNKLNGFNAEYKYSADYDFYARAICMNASFYYLDELPISCLRLHDLQLSVQKYDELIEEGKRISIDTVGTKNIYDVLKLFSWRFDNMKSYLVKKLRDYQKTRQAY